MNEERRILRARTFDEVAELYDQARRGYPEQLFDDLFALAEIPPDKSHILEVGCGTGQATCSLARRGCRVVCVEPGPNLVRIARRNMAEFPRVAIVNARFEDFDPAGDAFNMVFAATSWHWIDPKARYTKAASVLKAGGVLAFTWGTHAFPPGFDSFFTEIQMAYEAIGSSWEGAWPPPPPDDVQDQCHEIERSGYFEDVRVARHVWTTNFTADEYVAMMSTASDHRLMDPEKREWLFSEMRRLINARPGGRIHKHWLTILHIARRNSVEL